MTTKQNRYYTEARKAGYSAKHAHSVAKTLVEWDEAGDNVRISLDEEQENYFDVYGVPDAYTDGNGRRVSAEKAREEMCDLLERWGCYVVYAEYFHGGEWHQADSIGMCVYRRPDDWRENWYVPDLMRECLDTLTSLKEEKHWEAECAIN